MSRFGFFEVRLSLLYSYFILFLKILKTIISYRMFLDGIYCTHTERQNAKFNLLNMLCLHSVELIRSQSRKKKVFLISKILFRLHLVLLRRNETWHIFQGRAKKQKKIKLLFSSKIFQPKSYSFFHSKKMLAWGLGFILCYALGWGG